MVRGSQTCVRSISGAAEGAADPGRADSGAAKGARDVELPPWSKGRYGSAVGRAVHGVLQSVDLATGAGPGQAVAAQCYVVGVTDFAAVVTAFARSALNSEVVRAAAARSPLRESFVGTLLEGMDVAAVEQLLNTG